MLCCAKNFLFSPPAFRANKDPDLLKRSRAGKTLPALIQKKIRVIFCRQLECLQKRDRLMDMRNNASPRLLCRLFRNFLQSIQPNIRLYRPLRNDRHDLGNADLHCLLDGKFKVLALENGAKKHHMYVGLIFIRHDALNLNLNALFSDKFDATRCFAAAPVTKHNSLVRFQPKNISNLMHRLWIRYGEARELPSYRRESETDEKKTMNLHRS